MRKKKEMKITKAMQKTAADILLEFMFTKNMDEVIEVYHRVFERYDLCEDPFTGCPCTPEEYSESRLEYDRQIMIERYGHCDGL